MPIRIEHCLQVHRPTLAGSQAHETAFDRPRSSMKNIKGVCFNLGAVNTTKHFVIQSVSEESRNHKVDATEILPPYGHQNDTRGRFSYKIMENVAPKLKQNPWISN